MNVTLIGLENLIDEIYYNNKKVTNMAAAIAVFKSAIVSLIDMIDLCLFNTHTFAVTVTSILQREHYKLQTEKLELYLTTVLDLMLICSN